MTEFARDYGIFVKSVASEKQSYDSIREAILFLQDSGLRYFFGTFSDQSWKAAFRGGYKAGIFGHEGYVWLLSAAAIEFFGDALYVDAETEQALAQAMSGTGVSTIDFTKHPDIPAIMKEFQTVRHYRLAHVSTLIAVQVIIIMHNSKQDI